MLLGGREISTKQSDLNTLLRLHSLPTPNYKIITEALPTDDCYYSAEGLAAIYKKDCIDFLKSLPDNYVDVLATDPAYSGMNQKMKFGNGRIVGKYQSKDNKKWFTEFKDSQENYKKFLAECYRVMKENSHIYIMFDSYSLLSLGHLVREYFNVKNIITWDKVNMGMGHYFRRRHEFVLFATKGYKKLNSRSIPDVWRFKRIYKRAYPTQKPVELFSAMLAGSINEHDLTIVCDPFVGSGSSAIAALLKKCVFVGNDIDEKACKICEDRITKFINCNVDIYQNKPASLKSEKKFW